MNMPEAELSESVKAELEAGKEARAKMMKDFAERTKGKPTPTQAENDEAALGKYFAEHEADGADLEQVAKHMEAKPSGGGGYQTRQASPSHPRAPAKSSE
jgi:hypothetical protein